MDGALWMYALLALGTAPPLLPNAAVIASAGAMAATGELNLAVVLLVVAGSAVAGDAVIYGLGRLGTARALRWLSRTGRRRAALEWTATRIHAHGVPFVVGVRFLPSGRLAGGLTAAIVRFPARRYLLGIAIAEAIWASYSVGVGYWGGSALNNSWAALAIGPGVSVLVAASAQLVSLRFRRAGGHGVTASGGAAGADQAAGRTAAPASGPGPRRAVASPDHVRGPSAPPLAAVPCAPI